MVYPIIIPIFRVFHSNSYQLVQDFLYPQYDPTCSNIGYPASILRAGSFVGVAIIHPGMQYDVPVWANIRYLHVGLKVVMCGLFML